MWQALTVKKAAAYLRQIVWPAISPVAKDAAESDKTILTTVPTKVQFELKPVTGGPFENEYDIEVSALKLPAMINLEATA